jgi:hypothetical protein
MAIKIRNSQLTLNLREKTDLSISAAAAYIADIAATGTIIAPRKLDHSVLSKKDANGRVVFRDRVIVSLSQLAVGNRL